MIHPSGVHIVCEGEKHPIEVVFWDGDGVRRKEVSAKRALELADDLIKCAIRSELSLPMK